MDKITQTGAAKAKKDAARDEYFAAIQMIATEIGSIWGVFTAVLYSNIATLTICGVLITVFNSIFLAKYLLLFICILGLFSCTIWVAILRRQYAFHTYWFACARNAELLAFGKDNSMIQNGNSFSKGTSIPFLDIDKPLTIPFISIGRFSQILRVKVLLELVIFIIALLYVCIFVLGISYSKFELTASQPPPIVTPSAAPATPPARP